jgi:hypothetical protein
MSAVHTTVSAFISAVTDSSVLTPAQKREFLDQPDVYPQEYRDRIVEILADFDARASGRARSVVRDLEDSYRRFAMQLDADPAVTPDMKKRLLSRVGSQVRSMTGLLTAA